MGDWFQTIVDRDASEADSPELSTAILTWLVSEGIVSPNRCDCVFGEGGYPPGPHYAKAVEDPDDRLFKLRTNGLKITTTRTMFHCGQLGAHPVCSSCSNRFDVSDEWGDEWGKAVGEWYEKRGPGLLACPRCNHIEAITEWEHDPAFGFGNLGFEFWNWPFFTSRFLQEIGKCLEHRVLLVEGKS